MVRKYDAVSGVCNDETHTCKAIVRKPEENKSVRHGHRVGIE
jgi:hypothetical protein